MEGSVVMSFVSLFAFLALLLAVCIFRAAKKEHSMSRDVIKLELAIIIVLVLQGGLLFARTETQALVMHSLYLLCLAIIRLCILIIAVKFTEYVVSNDKTFLFIKLITALDCLLALTNIFTEQVFTCVKMQMTGGYYYAMEMRPLYAVHAIIAYSTITIILYVIVKKMIKISREYWGGIYRAWRGLYCSYSNKCHIPDI